MEDPSKEEECVMIMPTVRASVGRADALHLIDLVSGGDPELRRTALERLEEAGVDGLLDDPRVLNAVLTTPNVQARPPVVFYILVRQALLEGGIEDRMTADYVASMVFEFVRGRRAYRVSEDADEEYRYLVDIVTKITDSSPREAFMLRVHLGDFSLWLSGVFPDFIESRVRRRGAPPIRYYEEMGVAGYTMASQSPEAETMGVGAVFAAVSRHFSGVRIALNRVSDRYLFPGAGDPVDRLLREVAATAP
jgi:hypothetical protein